MRGTIGIIGFGHMGEAIAELLKSEYSIFVFDADQVKTKGHSGLNCAASLEELIRASGTLILAVKPQNFGELLNALKLKVNNKLVISIAAGITTRRIEEELGGVPRVVRTMPNMPCRIGKGMTCLCKGRSAGDDDLEYARRIFSRLGDTLEIKEEMMNRATAISGNGPAYVCDHLQRGIDEIRFLEEFKEAAGGLGFSPQEAGLLVESTLRGTKEFLGQSDISPKELKYKVASKGGSTEAALKILDAGGSLREAVSAALKRADELS